MIKIIQEGKIKHTSTCSHCGCIFEFDAEDVTRRTVWDDHGGHYPVCDFYELNCPYCSLKVDVRDNKFTKEEKEKMDHIDD